MAGKVALITAGGSGMGAACARKLAGEGYAIGILSSSGKGEALGSELGGFGVTGSNQDPAAIKALVDGAMTRWGRVDVLVNSAGHGPRGALLEISDEDWHRGIDIYLMNVIRPTRLVAPIMAAQGGRGDCEHLDRLGV
jgi:NAD(P)-dependent dehydrogenase (short-subunit alcohol dehydrogenase family)